MKHITLLAAMVVSFGATAQITDGSFEAGIGAGTWNEASVTYGTPLCTIATCGTGGGPAIPRTGDVYAWFGGSGAATEIGSVDQDANITSGTTANLLVYVKIPATGDGTMGNYMKAMIDGTEMGMLTAADSTTYADYTLWSVPIDAYADGAVHNVRLEAKENGGAVFNILADDIALEVDGTIIAGLFENDALSGVQIYPNPATTRITLSFNAMTGPAEVTITDASGKVVARQRFSEVTRRIIDFNSSDLQDGLYMISVAQAGKRTTQRVVVQH
ncbi:MAG: T9SS type A sorting domain-containing protein [Flavobacteriales bacterium]|nr:T9SS type A sorting domain-containing protein [Flavobacteriales bacterium]